MEKASLSLVTRPTIQGTGIYYFLVSTLTHPNCNVWPWALVIYHLALLAGAAQTSQLLFVGPLNHSLPL